MLLKRIGLAVAVVVLGVVGAGAGASAQRSPYPPSAATVVVSNLTPPAGGTITVTVRNCQAGEAVRFSLPANPPVTVTCVGPANLSASAALTEGATATATLTAPLQSGAYNGTAELLTSQLTLPFQVTVAAVTSPGGGLPATGSSGTQSGIWYGVGLLGLGLALLAVSRVRRRQTRLA